MSRPLLHCFCLSVLSVSCSAGLSLLSLGIPLQKSTHTHVHTNNSPDAFIFHSCFRIINNFVFIYLFVCIWGWQKEEVCVCVSLSVWGHEKAVILLFKCSTLKIYIILAGCTFLSGKWRSGASVSLQHTMICLVWNSISHLCHAHMVHHEPCLWKKTKTITLYML